MAFNFSRTQDVKTKSLDEIVDELIEVLKQSELYQEYVRQQDAVRDIPDVIGKINEAREISMKIQSAQSSEEAFDELEQLSSRFEDLMDDKRVYSFIKAENRFIEKYQEINKKIMEQIQFI